MTKVDIFSGFLGAGKTTLIKKLISEAYKGEKLVLIENEFGEIGVDSGFMREAGIEITEMNSGCICCSLVGDFSEALAKVQKEYEPDRILIEPSGVGKLSDVVNAVKNADCEDLEISGKVTVCDAKKCKMYMANFGEFYNNQIENADTVILSHTGDMKEEKIENAVKLVKELNPHANIVTTAWDVLTGEQIREAIDEKNLLSKEMEELKEEAGICPECGHHHHHEHEHHHHEHCCEEHHHEHHHHHDEECSCGCGHHHDHNHEHHHADDVFTSWGTETTKNFDKSQIENILNELINEKEVGMVLRAKGIVAGADGNWIHFDYVPGEADVRNGSADTIGRICVIGSNINEDKLKNLFNL